MSKRGDEARLRKQAEAGKMEAANDLAEVLKEKGDWAGAERWLRRAANAGYLPAALNLGTVLQNKGQLEEAEKWLKVAALSKNHGFEGLTEMGASVLGHNYLLLRQFAVAEHWLKIAAAAGDEDAIEDLEKLYKIRSDGSGGGTSGVLQTFEVSSVMFYDGSGHRLGPSLCTLTKARFIIDDARGGVSQIQLRDITGVSTPGRVVSPKQLRITTPGATYDIYCQSKDQKNLLEAWLSKAIRGA